MCLTPLEQLLGFHRNHSTIKQALVRCQHLCSKQRLG